MNAQVAQLHSELLATILQVALLLRCSRVPESQMLPQMRERPALVPAGELGVATRQRSGVPNSCRRAVIDALCSKADWSGSGVLE